jgi:dihydroflavonol-4-reductase
MTRRWTRRWTQPQGPDYALGMNQGKRGRVLVTGATGFVAGHCVGDLLARGYGVRGTVRNLKTADIAHLRPAIGKASGAFDVAEATLDADEGWADAASGCDYVLHVASPIPFKAPRHEDELIRPAVDGTTRVLTAAAKAGVKRVVCTSSLDVITRNSATAARQRTEADWSDLAECNAYAKSKLLAEKRAWDLAADHGIELAVVHRCPRPRRRAPPRPRGPRGEGEPVHLRQRPPANGRLPMTGIAAILKEEYGPRGYKIATRPLPAWILRVAAQLSGEAKLAVDMLGIQHDVSAEKAMRELGWTPRPLRESVLDTAESLISAGIVRPRKPVLAENFPL